MSHRKDTDYLAISARIRAMENRLLTRDRMDRIIDARDDAEARKVLAECGFIMADDDVEVNCTFETLVRLQREQLERDVANVLFK